MTKKYYGNWVGVRGSSGIGDAIGSSEMEISIGQKHSFTGVLKDSCL